MQCPNCKGIKNSVVDSRLTDNNTAIRRRRQCDDCDDRFTTFERLRTANVMVVKKDSTLEQYDREKLERGIWRACEKRPVNKNQVNNLLNQLEEQWAQSSETTTKQIGADIMEGLKDIDPVAYIRFASVYRQFSDAESFANFIKEFDQEEA